MELRVLFRIQQLLGLSNNTNSLFRFAFHLQEDKEEARATGEAL